MAQDILAVGEQIGDTTNPRSVAVASEALQGWRDQIAAQARRELLVPPRESRGDEPEAKRGRGAGKRRAWDHYRESKVNDGR